MFRPAALVLPLLLASCGDEGSGAGSAAARLRDPTTSVADRRESAVTLSTLADPAGAPALADALRKDSDPEVRRLAAFALGNLGVKSDLVLPALREALKDENDSVREAAAAALGTMGPAAAPAAEDLALVLREPGASVPQQAAFALSKIGAAAVGPLVAALDHSDENVRARALAALGPAAAAGQHPRIALAAARLLRDDPSWVVRRGAAALLGHSAVLIDPPEIAALVAGLSDPNPSVAAEAAEALGTRGLPIGGSLEALGKALDSGYANVRSAAAEALGRLGKAALAFGPRIAEGAAKERGETRVKFVVALWRLTDDAPAAVKALTEALTDENEGARQRAASALGEMGAVAAPAAAALGKALEDRAVRVRAAEALGRIGPPAAPAREALNRWATDPNEHFRGVVKQALDRIEGK